MDKDEKAKIDCAIKRLKKLGEIYYSHSKESQTAINQYVDGIYERMTFERQEVTASEVIEKLAEKFTNVHIAKLGISPNKEERKRFFIDVMFEKYNTDELIRSLR